MKVSELEGAKLDYWVARANGAQTDLKKMKVGDEYCAIQTVPNAIKPFPACVLGSKIGRGKYPALRHWYYPSSVWDHGGPIIEREKIDIQCGGWDWGAWRGSNPDWEPGDAFGETPLIAAMRAYVASKFGEEVQDDAS